MRWEDIIKNMLNSWKEVLIIGVLWPWTEKEGGQNVKQDGVLRADKTQ